MENGNFNLFALELQSFGGEEVLRGNLSKRDHYDVIMMGVHGKAFV